MHTHTHTHTQARTYPHPYPYTHTHTHTYTHENTHKTERLMEQYNLYICQYTEISILIMFKVRLTKFIIKQI